MSRWRGRDVARRRCEVCPEERVRGVIAGRGALPAAAQSCPPARDERRRTDADEALFQELAAALGYKQNKLPFTLLAQRLPLARRRAMTTKPRRRCCSGSPVFSRPRIFPFIGSETRGYVRTLWDQLVAARDELQRLVLPRKIWRLGGARPLNHPQRRLGALAVIARRWRSFMKSLGASETRARHARRFCSRTRTSHSGITITPSPPSARLAAKWRWWAIRGWRRSWPMCCYRSSVRAKDGGMGRNTRNCRRGSRIAASKRRSTRLFGDDPRRAGLREDSRAATGLASDLRGLLPAGQLRLRALSRSPSRCRMDGSELNVER